MRSRLRRQYLLPSRRRGAKAEDAPMLETQDQPDTVDVSRLHGQRGEDDAKRALLLAGDRDPGQRTPCTTHGAADERPGRRRVEDPVPYRWPFAEGGRYAARRRGHGPVSARPGPRLRLVDRQGRTARERIRNRSRWKAAYDVYFPSETDRANAIFVEVEVSAWSFGSAASRQSHSAARDGARARRWRLGV